MSLVDRSFEEVCAIMDRTGDTVELLVEHAADFRMCDLLDDSAPPGSGSGGGNSSRKSIEDSPTLGLVPGMYIYIFICTYMYSLKGKQISSRVLDRVICVYLVCLVSFVKIPKNIHFI